LNDENINLGAANYLKLLKKILGLVVAGPG